VREALPILGNLTQDFNFNQAPRPPLLLPTNPLTDSPSIPLYFIGKPACWGCTTPPPAARHTGRAQVPYQPKAHAKTHKRH
jgi:hypothetical protein